MGGAVFHKGQHAPRFVPSFLETVVLGLIGLACAAPENKFIEFKRFHDALSLASEHTIAAAHRLTTRWRETVAAPRRANDKRRFDAHPRPVADALAKTGAYHLQVVSEIYVRPVPFALRQI